MPRAYNYSHPSTEKDAEHASSDISLQALMYDIKHVPQCLADLGSLGETGKWERRRLFLKLERHQS